MSEDHNDKITVGVLMTKEDKRLLDAAHATHGILKGKIISLALRDWIASREQPLQMTYPQVSQPIPGFSDQPLRVVPGDVKERVLVVPRDQFKGNDAA